MADTEAQIYVDRLMGAGMLPVEIGKAVGAKSQQIRDIRRRKSAGHTFVDGLRVVAAGVAEAVPVAADTSSGHSSGLSQGMTTPESATADHTTATIDAEEAPRDERSTLDKAKDRLKSMFLGGEQPSILAAAPRSKASSGGDGRRGDFVDQAVPIVALAVALGADMLIRDPYKPCAPSEPEAAALVRPWLRIVSRQLEIAGRLTETQLDILNALGATALYGQRAWKTYKAIRAEHLDTGETDGRNSSTAGYGRTDTRANAQPNGASGTSVPAGGAGAYSPLAAAIRTPRADDAVGDRRIDPRLVGARRSGDDILADLYRRDRAGRDELGLE